MTDRKLKDKKKSLTVRSTPVATVKITVTNESRSGQPLDAADVEIVGVTKGKTNSQGVFDTGDPKVSTFKIFAPGTYVVKVSKAGFGPFTPPLTLEQEFSRSITFVANDQLSTPQNELTIRMGNSNPNIVVTVIEVPFTGSPRPMPGATVDIIGTAKGPSDNVGVFFATVPFGKIGVTVSAPGFRPETQPGNNWFEVIEVTADTSFNGKLPDYAVTVRMISASQTPSLPGTHPKPLALWLSGGPSSVAEDARLDPPSSVDTLKGQAGWDFATNLTRTSGDANPGNQNGASFTKLASDLANGSFAIPAFLGGGTVAQNQIRRLAIVGHGGPGEMDVLQEGAADPSGRLILPPGATPLTVANFQRFLSDIQNLSVVLANGALVYLVACNLATGSAGEQLVRLVSQRLPTVRVVAITTIVGVPTTIGKKGALDFPGLRDTRVKVVDMTDPINRPPDHLVAAKCNDLSLLPWFSENSPHATVARDGNIIRRGRVEA